MRARGRTNIYDMDIRIGQQLREIPGRTNTAHIQLYRLVVSHVAGDLRKVAIEMTSAGIAQSSEPDAFDLAIGFDMGSGHETKANNAYVDHMVRKRTENRQELKNKTLPFARLWRPQ